MLAHFLSSLCLAHLKTSWPWQVRQSFLGHRTPGALWWSMRAGKASPIPAEWANHCPIPPVIALSQSVLGGAFPALPARSFARNWNLLTPSFPAKTAALGLVWQVRAGRKSSKTLSCPQLYAGHWLRTFCVLSTECSRSLAPAALEQWSSHWVGVCSLDFSAVSA